MNNSLDLKKMGLVEMNSTEMQEVDGGGIFGFIAGAIVGAVVGIIKGDSFEEILGDAFVFGAVTSVATAII